MRTKVSAIWVLVVIAGAVLVGCGSSGSASTSTASASSAATSTPAAPSSSTAAPSSSASTTAAVPSSSANGGNSSSAAAAAAKQGCEAGLSHNPIIDASQRSALATECQKVADAAATGDRGKFKAAYTSFCTKLVGALPAAAQATAKSACEQGANAIP